MSVQYNKTISSCILLASVYLRSTRLNPSKGKCIQQLVNQVNRLRYDM